MRLNRSLSILSILSIFLVLLLPSLLAQSNITGSGGGAAVKACVSSPGDTTGAYRSQCQTSGGLLFACNNAAGCTLAGDWVGQGGTATSLGFDAITVGSNTSATMTVGTGGILTYTGNGIINASKLTSSISGIPLLTSGVPTAAVGGDIPAVGTSGQVPWNNGSGAYGADAGFAYNSGTNALGVKGPLSLGAVSGSSGSLNLLGSTSGTANITTNSTGAAIVFNKPLATNGSITLGQTSTATGSAIFNGLTSGAVTLKGADTAGTWSLTLPTTGGTNGYFLTTDGSGVTTWSAITAGVMPAFTGGDCTSSAGSVNLTCASIGGKAVTLANSLTTSGNYPLTITLTGSTNVTLPVSGVLTSDPTTTRGDIFYNGVSGRTRLPLGTTGQFLSSNGTDATYISVPGSNGQLLLNNSGAFGASSTSATVAKLSSGVPSAAAYTDVVGLWATGSCSGYLKNDGTCATPGGGDFSSNTATAVDSEVVLFSGTGGKTGKRATGTGIAKLTSGVLGTATAGTDYSVATPAGTAILKSDNAGGFSTTAAGTDYAAATNGTNGQVLRSNGSGGWGTALTVGTGANNLVQLNASSQLPAVSGALLTNLPGATHNFLSATHTDTTAASAVRGDGLFAIGASPTWQRLAHPTVTGGYFKWNATDIVASTMAASGTGACTNQVVTAANADAGPTCTTVTSSYVDTTIAKTGTDINTSNQVTATHLASALPAAQGGSGVANTATHTLGSANQNWATLGTGLVKNTTTTGALSTGASSDVIGLWSGSCTSSSFLRGDGACASPSGSGTVNVVGAGNLTSTALATGGGTTFVQTPAATATMDSSGNISTPGSIAATGGFSTGASGAFSIAGATQAKPTAPASGQLLGWFDSTDLIPEWENSSGTIIAIGVVPKASATANQWVTNIASTGIQTTSQPAFTNISGTVASAQLPLSGMGTITGGTWNGGIISPTYGGTGVNNGASTTTITGGFNITWAPGGSATYTLPATSQTIPGMNRTNTAGASMVWDLAAASVTAGFKPPAAAGAGPTTAGVVAFDSTSNTLAVGNGTATNRSTVVTGAAPSAGFSKFDGTTYALTSAAIAVTDLPTSAQLTTPKITTGITDANGNVSIAVAATASAVDGITITNAATANPATVALGSSGSDSNINLNLTSKGTGVVQVNGAAALYSGSALGTPASGTLTNALGLPVAGIAAIGANTIVSNVTGSSAVPTAAAAPSGGTGGCSGASDAVIYTAGTGWGCHTISGSGTVTSSGTPLIHQVPVFTTSTDIKGIAVGATDKPLVGVTGADPAFSKLTLTNPATAATLTIADGASLITAGAYGLTLTATATTNATLPAGTKTLMATDTAVTAAQLTAGSTIVAQKFFGTAAPGSVTGNLPGDSYTDTTNHHQYVCNATSGTAAPACTSVATAGWLRVDGGATTYNQQVMVGGTTQTQRYNLNFIAGTNTTITATDTGGTNTNVTINSTGSGGLDDSVYRMSDDWDGLQSTIASGYCIGARPYSCGTNGSGTLKAIAGELNHPGIIELASPATNNIYTALFGMAGPSSGQGQAVPTINFASAPAGWFFKAWFKLNIATGTFAALLGMTGTSSTYSDALMLRFDNKNFSDTTFNFFCGQNGASTASVNTTVAVDTAWHSFIIEKGTNANTIKFTFDGTAFDNSCGSTSIPTAAIAPVAYIGSNSSSPTATSLYLDKWVLQIPVTR